MRLLLLWFFFSALQCLADAPILRTFEEIKTAMQSKRPERVSFSVTGQVVSFHHSELNHKLYKSFSVFNDKTCLSIYDRCDPTISYKIGDIVHIRGYIDHMLPFKDNSIFATHLKTISRAPLPKTQSFDNMTAASKALGCQPVSVTGTVANVFHDQLSDHIFWVTLKTTTATLHAFVSGDDYSFNDFCKLIDSELLINGLLISTGNDSVAVKNMIQIFGRNGYKIVRQPPADPFNAPLFPCNSLHRQRTSGFIQGRTDACLFLTTDDGRFLTVRLSKPEPDAKVGDRVTVVGFPMSKTYGKDFIQSMIRFESTSRTSIDKPISITGRQLTDDPIGHEPVNYRYHGKNISIKGVLRSDANETAATGTFRLFCENREVEVEITGIAAETWPRFEYESVLQVTGVCVIEFENDNSTLGPPRFHRYLIVPHSADDIRLVARPKRWVTSVLLTVISALVLLLIAVSIWTKSLKILSERRGHALSLALSARVKAESRTQERTRLALELHDSISQTLTGVALQIDAATTGGQLQTEHGKAHLLTAKLLLSSCRKELQDCLWDLRSRTFEEKDMTEAILRTLAPYLGKCSILARFNVPREVFSESAIHSILNIIRELTANAIRHGHASHIHIAGEFKEGRVRFSVSDDGCGFDVSNILGPQDGHFGLQGVRERVNNFNGKINISSNPGKGTKVIVSFTPNLDATKNA